MREPLSVSSGEEGCRLDTFASSRLPALSRAKAQKLILEGRVIVNQQPCTNKSHRLSAGDRVMVFLPARSGSGLLPEPEGIPIETIYEDEDLLVVNKRRGMVVHPAPGHPSGTLVNALLYYYPLLSTLGGPLRPGIVHRLDKDTSGLLIVAKNDFCHQELSRQFKARLVQREYLALVYGRVPLPGGRINAPVGRHPRYRQRHAVIAGGREALTRYRVLAYVGAYTLLRVFLYTGRTHQVRVHMAYLGHPLAGDPVYDSKRRPGLLAEFGEGQFLHARRIKFTHPRRLQPLSFTAPLPNYFRHGLRLLKKRK